MKYLLPALIIFIILVFVTKRIMYAVKMAPTKSDSQYPTSELLIAQGAPKKTFLSDALQSSLGLQ